MYLLCPTRRLSMEPSCSERQPLPAKRSIRQRRQVSPSDLLQDIAEPMKEFSGRLDLCSAFIEEQELTWWGAIPVRLVSCAMRVS